VFGISAGAMFGRVALLNIASARINATLRTNLYQSLVKQDVAFFDKTRTGDLLNRLSIDTSVIASTLTDSVSKGIRRSIEGLGGLGVLVYLSPSLTGLMLSVVPVVAIGGVYYGRFIKSLSRQVQDALGKTGEFAEESLGGIRTIKLLTQEAHESAKYSEAIERVYDLARRSGIYSGSFYGAVGFAGNIALLTVMIKGGLMVIGEQLTFGELTSFMLYSFYVAFAFSGGLTTLSW
jgi:putative ABC transport system ATP-binding protein